MRAGALAGMKLPACGSYGVKAFRSRLCLALPSLKHPQWLPRACWHQTNSPLYRGKGTGEGTWRGEFCRSLSNSLTSPPLCFLFDETRGRSSCPSSEPWSNDDFRNHHQALPFPSCSSSHLSLPVKKTLALQFIFRLYLFLLFLCMFEYIYILSIYSR